MEKSMSAGVEPGQGLNWPLLFTAACGFALYWGCFFTMLMRNSFMDGGVELLWYHLFLRVVFLGGSGLACVIIARRADWMASERGARVQKAGAWMFSVVAASASLAFHSIGAALPLAFDLVAWGLAGMGLACLLMLWVELLAAFPAPGRTAALLGAMALGAPAYLVMNLLPFPFNIGLLCVSPVLSLGMLRVLEADPATVPAAFVPLAESRGRARWGASFKGTAVAYGVVFGLSIGSTTRIAASEPLFTGIACLLALGAGAAWWGLRRLPDRIRQGGSFRLMFPVLIIALIPMSFLQGLPAVACNLLLLGCYVFFEAVGIDLALTLAEARRASRVHLAASAQACLYLGLALGHVIGLAATSSGAMDYATLSAAALALVVVLAVFVTFAAVAPLAGEGPRGASVGAQGEGGGAEPGEGGFQARCEAVARGAGLSARETEVFMLLARGRGVEHIQNKLCISSHTVKTHVYNIYRKMGIGSREELLDAVEGD